MNKKIRLSKYNKLFAGVCGGIGEYFNIDPTFVRLGWVLAALVIPVVSFAAVAVVYLVCWAIFPQG